MILSGSAAERYIFYQFDESEVNRIQTTSV